MPFNMNSKQIYMFEKQRSLRARKAKRRYSMKQARKLMANDPAIIQIIKK